MRLARSAKDKRTSVSSRLRPAGSGLLIILLTLLVYLPALRAGFIWDDPEYVSENQLLHSPGGLARIWVPGNTFQYYPLVFTSFWIEYHLWGSHPLGYHLTNILLHACSAVLVWRLLRRLNVPAAWFCAAVFALHPVHVESVAWVTERKNVLAGLFYLLSLKCYLDFDRDRTTPRYFAALALFVLALLSKTVVCSLPLVLLLIGWYRGGAWKWRDLINLLPFFVVGGALGLLTVWLERYQVGAHGIDWELTFAQRILIAGRALWFYAASLLWPAQLCFIYPRWEPNPGHLLEWLAPLGVVAVLVTLWVLRARWGRGPLVALLFFVVTLVPALGFFDVFPFLFSFVADHFQYLASLGFIVLVVGGVAHALAGRTGALWRQARVPVAVIALLVLGALTAKRCQVYRDEETLYGDTLAKNPAAWMAHFNLGLILHERGDTDLAFEHFRRTVQLRPPYHKAHTMLARCYKERDDLDRAIQHYRAALQAEPRLVEANLNLGLLYALRRQYQQAIPLYRRALALRSPLPEANLALGNALLAVRDLDGAVEQYRRTLEAWPNDAPARAALGLALLWLGRVDDAVRELEAALALQPDLLEKRLLLAEVFRRRGQYARALGVLRQGLAHSPDHPRIAGALAWLLSTCPDDSLRDGVAALALAERSVGSTDRRDPAALKILAAAYAEAGRFEQALQTARQARVLATAANNERLVQELDPQIAAYQAGQPYRTAPGQ